MALKISDVGAGTVLLTIDDTGLICLGSGTPVTQLSINGIGVVDSAGNITNMRAPGTSMAPTSGTVTVNPGSSVTVTTLAGVAPTVQIDANWPNIKMQHQHLPVDQCISTTVYSQTSHGVRHLTGQFLVMSFTQSSDDGVCLTPISSDINYRWM
jgi:hypothetical protein